MGEYGQPGLPSMFCGQGTATAQWLGLRMVDDTTRLIVSLLLGGKTSRGLVKGERVRIRVQQILSRQYVAQMWLSNAGNKP